MHRTPAGPSFFSGRLWLFLNKRYDQKMVIVHGKSSENDAINQTKDMTGEYR